MVPVRVVPAFQPGEDRHACLGLAVEASTVDDFTLQCREEAFGQALSEKIGLSWKGTSRSL